MTFKPSILFFPIGLLLWSCHHENPKTNTDIAKNEVISTADSILDLTINAHSVAQFKNNTYQFTFRKKRFSIIHKNNELIYQNEYIIEGDSIKNQLKGSELKQWKNGIEQTLTTKESAKISEGLNSVIYFATLPLKLQDEAVITEWKGQVKIKGNTYLQLGITFKEEGGGSDHDDEFMYWINETTHQIDYLAYNYKVNNGGVRFRSAYNKRKVNTIIFQDYINFKAQVGTSLTDLPAAYENGQLEELSLIETEDIKHIINQ